MKVKKGSKYPLGAFRVRRRLQQFGYSVLSQVCGKLVENNSPNATRRKHVEIKGRKTRRKLTRRIIIECKLVE